MPLHWKHRVLTTGPPGKSLHTFLLTSYFMPGNILSPEDTAGNKRSQGPAYLELILVGET